MDVQPMIPTCYRHADRETRLACSSCGRPVCVECVQSAAVGQKCPECAAQPEQATVITGEDVRRQQTRPTPVTYTLMAVCVGVWLLGFVAPDVGETLYVLGAQSNPRIDQLGEWYRLFSAAFLHSPFSFTHILFNMYALYIFGPQLERGVGSAPFAALYVSSALAGGAAFFFLGEGTAVGASGAIFGLFGAYIATALRSRHTTAGRAGLRQLLMLLGINLALPLIIPNIAWEAHVGGLVAGFLVSLAWSSGAVRTVAARTLVGASVGVLSLALVVLG